MSAAPSPLPIQQALPTCLAGKDILLSDDVMITGTALTSCARTLLHAGAASVPALVFARVVFCRLNHPLQAIFIRLLYSSTRPAISGTENRNLNRQRK